jgi:catechol 2,3-dioxygenase-like lactoylglutathione lyase family enzyme
MWSQIIPKSCKGWSRAFESAQLSKFCKYRYTFRMIIGTHMLLYSRDAAADREFFRDVLGFRYVDAGDGWMIFAMSPAEAGIHPLGETASHESGGHAGQPLMGAVLYLMCDDLAAFVASLKGKNVECSSIETAPWGVTTTIALPSGSRIGIYQPRHPTALDLK